MTTDPLRTFTGKRVHVHQMTPDDVDLRDITHSLSMLCRFNGYVKRFYSVAEHSVLACSLAEIDHGRGSAVAVGALLHDACEAYVGDMPRPLKMHLPDVRWLEELADGVVKEALHLPIDPDIWTQVKIYDDLALQVEGRNVLEHEPDWLREIPVRYTSAVSVWCYPPDLAEHHFRIRLREYGYEVPL